MAEHDKKLRDFTEPLFNKGMTLPEHEASPGAKKPDIEGIKRRLAQAVAIAEKVQQYPSSFPHSILRKKREYADDVGSLLAYVDELESRIDAYEQGWFPDA